MEILKHIGFICWEIWKERCSAIFFGRSPCPVDVLRRSASLRYELLHGSVAPSCPSNTTMLSHTWHAPPPLWIKVNADGAWHRSSLEGDVRCIICNSKNIFVCGSSTFISWSSSIEFEAEAVLKGLLLAYEGGHRNVIVESDS
ncbi:hypothetical protein CerSpe_208940 [Prunus speciosa]